MNEAQEKPKQNQSDGKLPKRTLAAIIIMLLCSFYLLALALLFSIPEYCANCCKASFDFATATIATPLPLLLFIFSLSLVFKKRWAWWGFIITALINLTALYCTFFVALAHQDVDAIIIILLLSPSPFILISIILLVIDKGSYFASITKGRASGTIRLFRSPEGYISLLALVLFAGCLLFPPVFIYMENDYESHHCHVHGAYNSVKDDIQNVVVGYMTDHNGSVPTMSGTYSNANCSNCHVINISALLVANGGLLRRPPDGLNLSASGNDNCGGNASLGCETGNSYIWIVDTNANVFSYCAGAECPTNNSGYQGVWP